MTDQVWDKNCAKVANHLQNNCHTLEEAWSIVGDLGEMALKQANGQVLSTGDMSRAIGELYDDATDELSEGDVRVVKNTNAWQRYNTKFTRENNIRTHVGNLQVEGEPDDNNVRIR